MDLAAFANARPYLFHTTSFENATRLRRTRSIESTAALFAKVGRPDDPSLSAVREQPETLTLEGETVWVSDQAIQPGCWEFEPGWTLTRFLQQLNSQVFFWAGSDKGPSAPGVAHFKRFEKMEMLVLRVKTPELLERNLPAHPRFSDCASGSAPQTPKESAMRGAKTFRIAESFREAPARVKEVVFRDIAHLPDSTEWSTALAGPWQRF